MLDRRPLWTDVTLWVGLFACASVVLFETPTFFGRREPPLVSWQTAVTWAPAVAVFLAGGYWVLGVPDPAVRLRSMVTTVLLAYLVLSLSVAFHLPSLVRVLYNWLR